jgi:hypothetical protein
MSPWNRGDIEVCKRMARIWTLEQLVAHTGKPKSEIIERFPEVLRARRTMPEPNRKGRKRREG